MLNMNNKDIMNTYGIKKTKQRNLILDAIRATSSSLTAEQIFFQIHNIDANVSLSTVYRALDMFVEKGILKKSMMTEDNKALYSMNYADHKHHLICVGCKEITVIDKCPMAENYKESIGEQTNFQITGHNLEIYGYCSKCKK